MNPMLKIDGLNKHFDGVVALDDFSCDVQAGEILGIIGPNGAGKTTLFNVLTGFVQPDSGSAEIENKSIINKAPHKVYLLGVSRTFQKLRLIRQMSVLENIMLAFPSQKGEQIWYPFFNPKKINAQERLNTEKSMNLLRQAGLVQKVDKPAGELSYGQQKLLSLICCLASDPELILLDEPVAGINPAMIEKVSGIIRDLPSKNKTVILIEHNMDVVMDLCDRIVFMDIGKKISEGSPDQVRNDPKVIEAYIE